MANGDVLATVHPLFDRDTGEVQEPADMQELRAENRVLLERLTEKDSQNVALAKINAQQEAKIRRYEGEFADRATRDPKHTEIRDVLLYHRERMMSQRALIVPDSAGWRKVHERLQDLDAVTGRPAFTVERLCESVDGAKLDDWYFKGNGRNRADTVFRGPETVLRNLDRLAHAKGTGEQQLFAMSYPADVVYWLSEECACGHGRCHHNVQTNGGCCAVLDGEVCECVRFNGWTQRIAAWREAQESSPQEQA